MRPGGGKDKGSDFERKTCAQLSLWMSYGCHKDWYNRNVISGGRFTRSAAQGKALGDPGDITAAHRDAHELTKWFLIECKHHRDLNLEQLFFLDIEKGFIGSVYEKARAQAQESKRHPFVIAKQNMREPLVFVDGEAGWAIMSTCRADIRYHVLHRQSIYVFTLDDITRLCAPRKLFSALARDSIATRAT